MNYLMWYVVITLPLISYTAPRKNVFHKQAIHYRNQPAELEPLPDDVRDQLLLVHGINALTCVGQMMINHNNIDSVKQSGFNLLEALKNFVAVLVRTKVINDEYLSSDMQSSLTSQQDVPVYYLEHIPYDY